MQTSASEEDPPVYSLPGANTDNDNEVMIKNNDNEVMIKDNYKDNSGCQEQILMIMIMVSNNK